MTTTQSKAVIRPSKRSRAASSVLWLFIGIVERPLALTLGLYPNDEMTKVSTFGQFPAQQINHCPRSIECCNTDVNNNNRFIRVAVALGSTCLFHGKADRSDSINVLISC